MYVYGEGCVNMCVGIRNGRGGEGSVGDSLAMGDDKGEMVS